MSLVGQGVGAAEYGVAGAAGPRPCKSRPK